VQVVVEAGGVQVGGAGRREGQVERWCRQAGSRQAGSEVAERCRQGGAEQAEQVAGRRGR